MIAKLPSGYRQVEYIQSSGTQYVDTGVKPNGNTRVICDFQMTAAYTKSAGVFGARDGSTTYLYNLYLISASAFRTDYYGNYANLTVSNTLKRLKVDKNKNVTTLDGNSLSYAAVATQTLYSLYLFCVNKAGTNTDPANMKLYSCQIYDNGTLVRDYVPCINPSGVVGLYDLVNAKFYGNAGTGVFTAGRKVYSKSEITKLEYIESTGTQYVDTEFKPNQDTRICCDFVFTDLTGVPMIFGAATTALSNSFTAYYFTGNTNKVGVDYGTKRLELLPVAAYDRGFLDFNKNVVTFNGKTDSLAPQTFQAPVNLTLFARNTNGAIQYYAKARMHSCQIYDNDWLIRDYYPATVDGAIGLWDAVSGVLYTDAAGGTFIAGPVLITLEPPENLAAVITEAGVVLTWDAAENAVGYKVYRDMLELAETAETTYTDSTVKPNNNYIYGVSAYDAETETAATEISVYVETPYSPLELVTDRTSAALARVIELSKLDYKTEMTEAEQEEWRDGMKGAYNASDLNRVESAVDHLAGLLRALPDELKAYAAERNVGWDKLFVPPYDPKAINPQTKTDWLKSDTPTSNDMERYLSNVKLLRNALDYNTDALPDSMDNLTWSGANAIERALKALDGAIILFREDIQILIDNTAAAWIYSGEIYTGEV